jgi:hypothetical protein
MTEASQLNLPVLASGGATAAHIRFVVGHATGPILEGGQAVWRPGTVKLTGVSSAAVVSSHAGVDFAVVDNSNALSLINYLGQTVDIALDVVWSD